jgi:carboxynorspermidine decarboxylase
MEDNKENIFIEPWIKKEDWNIKDFDKIETPTYVVSLPLLERNLKILKEIQKETGVQILMALKSFSMFKTFPLCKKYLSGTEASSVNEARLGYEKFGKEVHTFSPSYTEDNIKDYIKYSNHLIFNSFSEWNRLKNIIKNSKKKISCGMRVNLEHSESDVEMYDPSKPNSQFGVTIANFEEDNMDGLEGLHFHNLCELNADALERSLKVFEEKFGKFFNRIKWVNLGGGHHITREDYDRDLLIKILKEFKTRYPHLRVFLEPGEAIALNAGILVGKVIDIFKNGKKIAVLDVSPTCHMPDVIEMPYKPSILNGDESLDESKHIYRFVGQSCLTGDIIGDYSFEKPLELNQKIVFLNMAIYTMVKNNTFNGINLPNIAIMDKNNIIKIIKKFNYKDFKNRLS